MDAGAAQRSKHTAAAPEPEPIGAKRASSKRRMILFLLQDMHAPKAGFYQSIGRLLQDGDGEESAH
jgi:hypothetical protein